MDIKTLLLKSLSLKGAMHGSRRIPCGKSWVVIKYVINGNIFNVKAIKIKRTHESWAQRMTNYKKDLRSYRSMNHNPYVKTSNTSMPFNSERHDKETLTEYLHKHAKGVQTEILRNSWSLKHSATQTIGVQKHAKEIQTETKSKPTARQPVSLITTAQQTIASARFSRSMSFNNKVLLSSKTSSTALKTESKAVQCKRSTQAKASYTETDTRHSFTQVENNLPTDNSSLPQEFGVFIYMLNEIGETVISQNQILKSNAEMIKHLVQISTLKQSTNMNNSSYRSISTQTDQLASIEKKNSFCQTKTESTKQRRKLLLFRGRNSQRKKMQTLLNEDMQPG